MTTQDSADRGEQTEGGAMTTEMPQRSPRRLTRWPRAWIDKNYFTPRKLTGVAHLASSIGFNVTITRPIRITDPRMYSAANESNAL